MLKIILLVIALLIVGVVVFASTKPNVFSIARKLHIKASPEKIFAEVNDFNRWKSWSPWERKDLAMQRIFSGPTSGVGTIYEWNGNKNVGQGRMEILESNASQKLIIKLDFFKPFEAHNIAEFNFTSDGDGTLVSWEMRGPQIFIGKLMSVFIDCDKMVGPDFEAGLRNLQKLTESSVN
jgi:Polyketide cyclase / dehydrase and lipid transport